MNQSNNFDRLSSGISASERQDMLKKLGTITSKAGESESLVSEPPPENELRSLEEKLKSESIFLRIFMYIKALFSSSNIETEYNQYLITKMVREIYSVRADIIDPKRNVLLEGVFSRIQKLKQAATFFRPYIDAYIDDEGGLYVFLASVISKDFVSRIENEVNPYSIPLRAEVLGDARTSLLRKLDVILQEIPLVEKERMYMAVQGVHWLRLFCKLPFDKLITRFVSLEASSVACPIDTANDEIAALASVLCNGKKISMVMLESLFLFASPRMNTATHTENADETEDQNAVSSFLQQSLEHISSIKMTITELPLRRLGCIAFHSSSWSPDMPKGIEDWFVVLKTTFKKLFDQKWNRWLKDRKRTEVEKSLCTFLNVPHMPELEYKPWNMLWDGMNFHREMTITFLNAFYLISYPDISKILKIIMIEGDFYQRDNRLEFTDSYNELNHQSQNVVLFNEKLNPKGQFGQSISKIVNESVRSVQNKARLDNILLTMESEANVIVAQFCASCRSMISILGGVIAGSRSGKYDTLANISTIQGKYNEQFRIQIKFIKDTISTAYEIIKEIEGIEVSS